MSSKELNCTFGGRVHKHAQSEGNVCSCQMFWNVPESPKHFLWCSGKAKHTWNFRSTYTFDLLPKPLPP